MEITKYPRKVIIENPKLKKLLEEKTAMVLEGREKSIEIEEVEKEMDAIDKEIVAIEATVDVKDLEQKANEITERFNEVIKEMEGVKNEIAERYQQKVPKEMGEKYEAKKKEKELKENERNKIALKVQKWKDKIISVTHRSAKPYLTEEFEDFHDIILENGELVLTIFSHLEDYKALKRSQLQKKKDK
jgi:hypothetical protein